MSLVKFQEGKNRNVLAPGFSDIFESFFNDSFLSDRMISRVPAVNVAETDEGYHIELAAPGLKKEDFKIDLERNMLNISVEKKSEETENNKKYNKREYSYTSFVRSFTLPDSVDDGKIEAEYNDGILRIKIAKQEESKTASRHIQIR
ncbi:MAG: Hsp20/alpha crystallin family protein [Mucilaginibacter sp.]|nr:Hsp20/alpha crystallin family protein [Mucilaginibacter sp.]